MELLHPDGGCQGLSPEVPRARVLGWTAPSDLWPFPAASTGQRVSPPQPSWTHRGRLESVSLALTLSSLDWLVSEVRSALAQSRPCLSDLGSRRGLQEQAGQRSNCCCPGAGQPWGKGEGWLQPHQSGRSRGKREGHPGKRSWDHSWDSRAVRSRVKGLQGGGHCPVPPYTTPQKKQTAFAQGSKQWLAVQGLEGMA